MQLLLKIIITELQMLAKYDQDVVKNLMPLIVNVLGIVENTRILLFAEA